MTHVAFKTASVNDIGCLVGTNGYDSVYAEIVSGFTKSRCGELGQVWNGGEMPSPAVTYAFVIDTVTVVPITAFAAATGGNIAGSFFDTQ